MRFRRPSALLVALSLLVGAEAVRSLQLRYTLTGSAPRGLYRATPLPLRRGAFVALCLPSDLASFGVERHYLEAGACPLTKTRPVVKQIAALPGDLVLLADEGLRVNGVLLRGTARRSFDRAGRPVPALPPGLYRVPASYLWLVATADAQSWDSRYYGPLPELALRETLEPILTWP